MISEVDGSDPADISYVSAGYAPLLVRLVESLVKHHNSWAPLQDTLKLLPGPHIEVCQLAEQAEELSEALARHQLDNNNNNNNNMSDSQ